MPSPQELRRQKEAMEQEEKMGEEGRDTARESEMASTENSAEESDEVQSLR